MKVLEDVVWSEKYRPHTVSDCILPKQLKDTFQNFVNKGHVPALMLSGSSGIGKTTVAKAMLDEIGADYLVLNASLDRNIDTLRTEISSFASTVSFSGGRKYVILDEADYLNAKSFQPALRNFMEEYSENCGFIMTCNFKNRIIPALHSRTSLVEFKFSKADLVKMAGQFMKRVEIILKENDIKYERKVVAELISKYLPDWRRVLNELERYSATGTIDSGILASTSVENFAVLMKALKEKNFKAMRTWVVQNFDSDSSIYRTFYDHMYDFVKPQSIPSLVLLISEYQYRGAFVADPEIHIVAFLTNIMLECEFI